MNTDSHGLATLSKSDLASPSLRIPKEKLVQIIRLPFSVLWRILAASLRLFTEDPPLVRRIAPDKIPENAMSGNQKRIGISEC